MRAVVKTQRGDGRIKLINVGEPSPQTGWVVLEVNGAGLGLDACNSNEVGVVEAAQEATQGRDTDLTVDTSGAEGAINSPGVSMPRLRGRT